jgi:hypothetical protein
MWVDASVLALLLIKVRVLSWCWLLWLLGFLLYGVYHKCTSMRH